jgi:hypothetical protein
MVRTNWVTFGSKWEPLGIGGDAPYEKQLATLINRTWLVKYGIEFSDLQHNRKIPMKLNATRRNRLKQQSQSSLLLTAHRMNFRKRERLPYRHIED